MDGVNGISEKEMEARAQFGGSGVSLTPVVKEQPTVKMSKARIIKNLLVVSFGFLCLFTSFNSLANLQSSLNKEDGLGVGGLSIIYGALVVSCMFSPPFIIARLGCKWTVFASMLCYILYMGANFYAVWGTIVPSAIILGFGAAPLWSAKCTYLTETATWYAKQTGATVDDIINRFFGVFFMLFQSGQIWGNLISSLVFRKTESRNITAEDLLTCGADFCPSSDANNTNLDKPDMDKIYKVCGIYIGCAVLAVIVIAVGLDPITLDREDGRKRQFSFHLVLETAKHLWRSNYQKLLVILTMYSGVEQAFATGDYTKSFVACALGIEDIGFVMICYGVVDAICSFSFGRLVQFVGHTPFFLLAFLLHGGLQITFLLWKPNNEQVYLFYIFAALWGMGDAVIQTQINALYGMLWTKDSEAAFANYRLWESLGFIIAFACQNFLCTNVKIYICMGFLCVGMMLYGVVEIAHRRDHDADKNTRL
ncbi:protein unc-93 homolog A-like [Mercenaria mercenaria]|uniref:protein unc-93 homolog A-like n=1 Tax=Mercenaria mercenaria TaxID=6596 RepID=UPI001E1DF555|nr:protein unc-93 homolog A-like [Mercenaria mercenaria]XP_045191369.1 protein unc-93 homolog A-like [Mercenaria mercenaria]XP_045191370.1 protein unc-93 homolog A-like [Mercenaria mercenaria]